MCSTCIANNAKIVSANTFIIGNMGRQGNGVTPIELSIGSAHKVAVRSDQISVQSSPPAFRAGVHTWATGSGRVCVAIAMSAVHVSMVCMCVSLYRTFVRMHCDS